MRSRKDLEADLHVCLAIIDSCTSREVSLRNIVSIAVKIITDKDSSASDEELEQFYAAIKQYGQAIQNAKERFG